MNKKQLAFLQTILTTEQLTQLLALKVSKPNKLEKFIKIYDDGKGLMYKNPDAMKILENSTENFVNLVIDCVDNGYKIGIDLPNFTYDEVYGLWAKKKELKDANQYEII